MLAGESLKLCLDRFGRVFRSTHAERFFAGAKRFSHQGHDLVKLRGAHAQVLKQRDILDLTFHPRPPAVQLALFRKDRMDRSDWFRFFLDSYWILVSLIARDLSVRVSPAFDFSIHAPSTQALARFWM